MPNVPLDPSIVQQVKLLYLAGMSGVEIAKRVSLPPSTVRQLAYRYKWKDQLAEALTKLRGPQDENVVKPNECRTLVVTNPPRSDESKRIKTLEINSETGDEMVASAAELMSKRREEYQRNMSKMSETVGKTVADLPGISILASAREIDAIDKVARRSLGLDGDARQSSVMTIHFHPPAPTKTAPPTIEIEATVIETEG